MNGTHRTYPIVFAANERFSIPLLLAVESLLKVAAPTSRYEVHVMDDGISDMTKDYLVSLENRFNYSVTFHDVSEIACNLPTTYYFPKVTYARFMLPSIFAGTPHRRIFYSDADVFFTRDIAPVYDTDMKGCVVAGVQELNCLPPVIHIPDTGAHISYVERWSQRFGVDTTSTDGLYINAGTILLDITEFENKGFARRCLDECEQITLEKAPLLDQDVLNYVCWGHTAPLPVSYGAIPLYGKFYSGEEYYPSTCKYTKEELALALTSPAIIHFAGQKPRVLEGARYPLEQQFIDFWKQSAWRGYMPYSPRIGSLSPSRFIQPNTPIKQYIGELRKQLIKYTVASYLFTGERRKRYAMQRDGLRTVLRNAKACC
ncbi:MAG: glycosyltransferase family 8 protein [Akkermansia sp.]|nr:glycosyltransferase family 8 protein [Akkermansia sp.]